MSFRYAANPSLKNSFFTCLRKVRLFGRRRLPTKRHPCNQKLPCGTLAKRCPREAVPRKTVPSRNGLLRSKTPRSGTPRSGPFGTVCLAMSFEALHATFGLAACKHIWMKRDLRADWAWNWCSPLPNLHWSQKHRLPLRFAKSPIRRWSRRFVRHVQDRNQIVHTNTFYQTC